MDRVAVAVDILRTHGPMSEDELVDRVIGAGAAVSDRQEFMFELTEGPLEFWGLDLVGLVEHVLPGRVFTHRLTATERAGGFISAAPDLGVLLYSAFENDVVALAGGGQLEAITDYVDDSLEFRLVGPSGWLDAHPPGVVLGFRWDAGVVSVAPVDLASDADVLAPLVARAYRDDADDDGVAYAEILMSRVAVLHPEAFSVPRPPVDELLAAAGLKRSGDAVAPVGFDWEALAQTRRDRYAKELAERAGLDEIDGRLLSDLAVGLTRAWRADGAIAELDAEIVERVAVAFTSPYATDAFLSRAEGPLSIGSSEEVVARLDALADQALAYLPRRRPAGALMAKARVAERRGDALSHERFVKQALAADDDFDMALEDAAIIASERGDARRMRALLDQLESEDGVATAVSVRFSEPGPLAAGRNDPCGCGSGRKYKDCCARFYGHDLAERVAWLWEKANAYIRRDVRFGALWDLAVTSVGMDPDEEDPESGVDEAVASTLDHMALADLVLFEGDGLVRFVEERGALLPTDELALCREWAKARHRLWRIGGVAGDALVLEDAATGEELTVEVGGQPEIFDIGAHILAVVVPVPGGRRQLWGTGIGVPPAMSRTSSN